MMVSMGMGDTFSRNFRKMNHSLKDRLIRHMDDLPVLLLHVQHLYLGAVRTDEHTRVRALAATLREEGGTIQYQAKVLPFHAAGKHLSREGVHMAVRVI